MKLKYFAWVRERIGKPEETDRTARRRQDCRGADRVARRARRDLRPRFRNAARDSRSHRPRPRQTGCGDCRRPRDRLLPADDRRMSVPS